MPLLLAFGLLAACARDHRGATTPDDDSEDGASAAASDAGDARAQLPEGLADASVVPTLDAAILPDAAALADAAALPDAIAPSVPDAARPACDEVLELRAHGGQTLDDVTPFTPTAREAYERFYFAPNWTTAVHLVGVEPLPDSPVGREWALYLRLSGLQRSGSHNPDVGLASPDDYLLAAWSSEAPSMPIPDDVGIKLAQGDKVRLALEIHYAWSGGPPNPGDRSGVRLCLSRTLRAKEATLHWLGTTGIINHPGTPSGLYEASGTCVPQQASHLVGYLPRMRRNGRHMRMVAQRNGMDYPLIDRPFSLENKQFVAFPSEVSTQKGDVLKTTCTYDATRLFTFGPSEDDEECFALVLAWPAGSLSDGGLSLFGGYGCYAGL